MILKPKFKTRKYQMMMSYRFWLSHRNEFNHDFFLIFTSLNEFELGHFLKLRTRTGNSDWKSDGPRTDGRQIL